MSSGLESDPLAALKGALERLKVAILSCPVKLETTIALVIAVFSSIENVTMNVDALRDLGAYIGDITIKLVDEAYKEVTNETDAESPSLQECLPKLELELSRIHSAVIEMRHAKKGSAVQRFRKSADQKVVELKKRLDDTVALSRGQKKLQGVHEIPASSSIDKRLQALKDKVDELVAKLQSDSNVPTPPPVARTLEESQTSQIWEDALRVYEQDTKCDPTDDSGCRDATDIVRRLVRGTKDEFEAYSKKGEALRKVIKPILDVAQWASEVLKDSDSPTSPVSSVIAAAVKFLVKAGRNYLEQYDLIIAILKELHGFMAEFTVYRQFTLSPSLQEGIVKFFSQLLKALAVITGWMTASNLRKSFDTFMSHSEIKKCLTELERRSKDVGKLVAANTLKVSTGTHHIVSAMSDKLNISEDEAHHKSICRWLAAPMPFDNHHKHLKRHSGTTGSWFLEGEQYTAWKQTRHSLFWLRGKSGSGKTVLTAAMIDSMEHEIGPDLSFALAYFYFDFNDSRMLTCAGLLSSLVTQLLCRCPAIPKKLSDLYSNCSKSQRPPTGKDLVPILHDMLQSFREVYIILDGLDECKPLEVDGRHAVLALIKELSEAELPGLHLLISSRQEPDIKDALHPLTPSVRDLDRSIVDADIQQYLSGMLASDPYLKPLNSELKTNIETTLLNKADGMFRWIDCQVQSLKLCRTAKDIRKALEELPTTLEETYARYLHNIPKRDHSYVHRVLAFLAFATQRMALKELSEIKAVNIEPNDLPRFDPDDLPLDLESILSLCSGLITTISDPGYEPYSWTRRSHQRGGTVYIILAHFSVKEYLLSSGLQHHPVLYRFHLLPEQSHTLIAKVYLNYLLRFGENTSVLYYEEDNPLEPDLRLAFYAAQTWTSHVDSSKAAEAAFTPALFKLFEPQSSQFKMWTELYHDTWMDEWLDTLRIGARHPSPCWLYHASEFGLCQTIQRLLTKAQLLDISTILSPSALRIASANGHQTAVQLLLDNGADVNGYQQEDSYRETALHAASGGGHETVVRLLIEMGADVNAQGGRFGTALQAASAGGHETVVRLLIEMGADVNTQGGKHGTALQAASAGGHETLVRLLIEMGADVNAQGGRFGTALRAASAGGHETLVRLLIEMGADVNAKGGRFGTALRAASAGGHETLVRLLIEKGADVNAQGGRYGTALQAASGYGHEPVVRLLIEVGADVNTQGGLHPTALQAASAFGHETVVRLLIEMGVDVKAQGGRYGTALQAASVGGHETVARLLIEKGADVNTQGGLHPTALQAASAFGHETVVRLLIDMGADVNAQGGMYGTALQAASAFGHETVVRLLIEKGADVKAQGRRYGTALQAASVGGHETVARLLIEKGADVNTQGGEHGTALQAASAGGHEAVARLLMEMGADVNAQGGRYGTALQAASAGGHETLVRLLIEKGADVNAQGGLYGTALQAASVDGHATVVRLLIDMGAGMNAQGGRFGTALQAASAGGHETLVRLLIEKGADMDALGGKYGTALIAGATRDHGRIYQLLLDSGADPSRTFIRERKPSVASSVKDMRAEDSGHKSYVRARRVTL